MRICVCLFVFIVLPITRQHRQHVANEIVTAVNTDKEVTWKAGNSKFDHWFPKAVEHIMGVSVVSLESKRYAVRKQREAIRLSSSQRFMRNAYDLPEHFDSREEWPFCADIIGGIRDQGSCGSCWAFGAVEAMSDRICIASSGHERVELSAQDLVACCSNCGMGCHGGWPYNAWRYWIRNGLVSGGNYDSHSGCIPYSIPDCEHHSNGSRPDCGDYVGTPKCVRHCEKDSDIYEMDKHYGKGEVGEACMVEDIMAEIKSNGPVEASLLVSEDFLNYVGGVYRHVKGNLLGGHAIKMIGWGTTPKGEDYWLCVNSWNSDWGEKGLFRIRRGSDECGIESGIVFASPDIQRRIIIPSKTYTFRQYLNMETFSSTVIMYGLLPLALAIMCFITYKRRIARSMVTMQRQKNGYVSFQ